MNSEMTKGKWIEFRGKLKEKWGELTNDELDKTEGNVEQILGKITTKYGEELESTRASVNSILKKINNQIK